MDLIQPLKSAAAMVPNAVATIFGNRVQTWGAFIETVSQFSGALQALGVKKGDRVAILALNSDRYLQYYFASWWIGAVVVPMNIRWSVAENVYSLNDSKAEILFVDGAFVKDVQAILQETHGVRHVISLEDNDVPIGMQGFSEFLNNGIPVAATQCDGSNLAGIYYTGGTTGFPKGVVLSHEALWYNGIAGSKHLCMEPGDRYLHSTPMFHLADGVGSLGMTMVGGTHIFIPGFTPEGVFKNIIEHKATHVALAPTMIRMALQEPSFSSDNFPSLKYILYGSSPMPEGLLRDVLAALPGVKFIQGYGQTEMGPMITILQPDYHTFEGQKAGKVRSAGQPVCGCLVQIVDKQGTEVPRGKVGEIRASSPGIMQGYWNLVEQTKMTLVNGSVLTGDVGYMDEDGFVFIVDRVKDMIVTGGENVFSAEVENVISSHPGVAEVAVIGVPSEKWGESVHAIVVLKPPFEVSESDIISHCRRHIANYKLPKRITFREEPLPLSGVGKVLKQDLRKPYWKISQGGVN